MENPGELMRLISPGGLLSSLVLLAATWFLVQVMTQFFNRLGDRFTDQRLRLQQTATFVRFGLYFLAIAGSILLSFKLSQELILALGGTLAVMLGIALKDLAASVLAGLTILIDKPFQVGDRVSFGGHYGEVSSLGLRSVRLITLDDNLVTIPNSKFLTDAVSCGNAGALDMLIQMDFHIGLEEDLPRAKEIVGEALTSSRYAFLEKPWSVTVAQVVLGTMIATRIRAKVYVLDVKFEKALETDVTERVMEGFADHGVRPPAILHRDVGREEPPSLAAWAAPEDLPSLMD